MDQQIQINDTDDEYAAELEAVKTLGVRVAQQNELVLKSLETLRGEMVAQAETLTAMFASLVEAIQAIQINVPASPPPVVNLPAPVVHVEAAAVTIPTPEDKKVTLTFKRDQMGRITSPITGTVE